MAGRTNRHGGCRQGWRFNSVEHGRLASISQLEQIIAVEVKYFIGYFQREMHAEETVPNFFFFKYLCSNKLGRSMWVIDAYA